METKPNVKRGQFLTVAAQSIAFTRKYGNMGNVLADVHPISLPEGAVAFHAVAEDLYCQHCGYNLRGSIASRCPECGASIEYARTPPEALPWSDRKQRGRIRSYWSTVILVMFRQRAFCERIAFPVSYVDSQKFRCWTIGLSYVPLFIASVVLAVWPPTVRRAPLGLIEALHAVWPVAVAHLCYLGFLLAATGVPSYFFHPRGTPIHLQNRAIALSYYAAAALAWTFVPMFLATAALYRIATPLGEWMFLFAGSLMAVLMLNWWVDLIRIMKRLLPNRPLCRVSMALSVPVLWCAAGAMIFTLLPAACIYIALVVTSLC